MLNKQDKAYLRKESHNLRPLFNIGKEGISENFIDTLNDSLLAHELVKVSLLKTSPISINEAGLELSMLTHSEVVHIVGHTVVLYKRSKKNKMGL